MAVSVTTNKNRLTSNGSTTAFNFTFPLPDTDTTQVNVKLTVGSVDTVQDVSLYSVTATNNDFSSGGTVTFTTAPAAGTITIYRNLATTQTSDYVAGGLLDAATLEGNLDKLTMLVQEQQDAIDRSVKFPVTDATALTSEIPNSSGRASNTLIFDSSGNVGAGDATTTSVTTGTEGWADTLNSYDQKEWIKLASSVNVTMDATATYSKVNILYITTSTNARVVTLPAEADSDGRYLAVIKVDSATGTVTINNDGGSTACARLTRQYEVAHVICDGTNWYLLNRPHNTGDNAYQSFGTDGEVHLQHVHNDGLILKNTGGSFTVLNIQSSDTDVDDGQIIGEIDFQAPDEASASGDNKLVAASIAARSEGDFSSTNNATELVFKTGASEDASTGAADGDMILSSAGALSASSFKLFGSVNPTPVDFGVVNNSTGFQNAIAGLGTGYGECAGGGRMVASYPSSGELAITFTYAGVYLLCIQMGNSGMGANDITAIELRAALESETTATVVDLGFSGNADDRIFALSGVAGLAGANISGTGWYNVTATAGQLVQFNPRAEFTTSDDGEDINQKIFTAFMVWG
ncbi:MAG: hypothetical protein Unbinned6201contig1000_25 [Prokaryotic dsDNA virus sp.]|nr:MAG: hypothetical protein Unbinned6201contig1000_25 [Prokaryotic dsDNA virus sp.]